MPEETEEVVGTDLAEEGKEVEVLEAAFLAGHAEGVPRGLVVAAAKDLVGRAAVATAVVAWAQERAMAAVATAVATAVGRAAAARVAEAMAAAAGAVAMVEAVAEAMAAEARVVGDWEVEERAEAAMAEVA